jgi:zinc transport system permease protein
MDRLYAWLAELASRGQLPDALRYPFVARGLLAVLVLAPLLGGMSHLVVARRLAFFSTALGQAALTGLTLGLLAGEPIQAPYAGIFGFCLVSAILMVYVKRRSRLPPDTLVGVFMALTLGLGICLLVAATKQFNIHQIEAVMFGSLLTVTDTDLLLLVVAAAGVLAVLARFYNALLLDSLGRPLASASGVNTALCEYLFVVLLTLAIVVSLKVIGALLVEALVVVPAAAARNLARSTRGYLAWSVASALVTGAAGIFLSTRFRVPTGGAVVLALAACFFVTLAIGAGLRRGEGR